MGLKKLDTLSSYEEINGGAHRKPASILGTPSLVRRIGFWNTGLTNNPTAKASDKAGAGGDPTRLDPETRAKAYTTYITNLSRVLCSLGERQVHIEIKDFVHTSDPTPQSGDWSALSASGGTASERQFASNIIASISLLPRCSTCRSSLMRDIVEFPETCKVSLSRHLNCSEPCSAPRPYNRERYRRVGYYQDVVWEEFERTILNGLLRGVPFLKMRSDRCSPISAEW